MDSLIKKIEEAVWSITTVDEIIVEKEAKAIRIYLSYGNFKSDILIHFGEKDGKQCFVPRPSLFNNDFVNKVVKEIERQMELSNE